MVGDLEIVQQHPGAQFAPGFHVKTGGFLSDLSRVTEIVLCSTQGNFFDAA
jgi:hypothetical protein